MHDAWTCYEGGLKPCSKWRTWAYSAFEVNDAIDQQINVLQNKISLHNKERVEAAGMDTVFVRFQVQSLGGKEKHRGKAMCNFCDTDFNGIGVVNGGEYAKMS